MPIDAQPSMLIVPFVGARAELRSLFAQADDSPLAVASYIERGDILVAVRSERIVGHAQLVAAGAEWEIKSVAVVEQLRGRGIGSALVRAALDLAFSEGAARVSVATAAADIGNLCF